MQSFDENDRAIGEIVPVDNFEQIIDELKKPDVEYVKVFMHNGFPSIKKDVPREEALMDSLIEAEINVNELHGRQLRKELNRRG